MVVGASCSSSLEKTFFSTYPVKIMSALGFSQIWGVAEEKGKKLQAAIVS
jgi:hypothetical protein